MGLVWVWLGQEVLEAGEDDHLQMQQSASSQTPSNGEESPRAALASRTFSILQVPFKNVTSSEASPDHSVERILIVFLLMYLSKTVTRGYGWSLVPVPFPQGSLISCSKLGPLAVPAKPGKTSVWAAAFWS